MNLEFKGQYRKGSRHTAGERAVGTQWGGRGRGHTVGSRGSGHSRGQEQWAHSRGRAVVTQWGESSALFMYIFQ